MIVGPRSPPQPENRIQAGLLDASEDRGLESHASLRASGADEALSAQPGNIAI